MDRRWMEERVDRLDREMREHQDALDALAAMAAANREASLRGCAWTVCFAIVVIIGGSVGILLTC